ncbi:hypothetical protein EC2762100_0847 [Escherichia coli 2762100]|nr:hypothetical protein EC2762100_0847 [Escherichia coli 2762100]
MSHASTCIPRCLRDFGVSLHAGGVTPFTVPLWSVKVRPVIHDGFFSGTCCTRDGIRPSRSHGYSPAEQALAQRRQLQPPHAVSQRRQEHGSLSPSRRR